MPRSLVWCLPTPNPRLVESGMDLNLRAATRFGEYVFLVRLQWSKQFAFRGKGRDMQVVQTPLFKLLWVVCLLCCNIYVLIVSHYLDVTIAIIILSKRLFSLWWSTWIHVWRNRCSFSPTVRCFFSSVLVEASVSVCTYLSAVLLFHWAEPLKRSPTPRCTLLHQRREREIWIMC